MTSVVALCAAPYGHSTSVRRTPVSTLLRHLVTPRPDGDELPAGGQPRQLRPLRDLRGGSALEVLQRGVKINVRHGYSLCTRCAACA
jgi:hypothetical protein